jgi:hypothetical protein
MRRLQSGSARSGTGNAGTEDIETSEALWCHDPKGSLFRTIQRGTERLSDTPLPQANAYAMVRRRALGAGIGTNRQSHVPRDWYQRVPHKWWHAGERRGDGESRIDPHHAALLYDRRHDVISLDEVERIRV